MRIPTVKVLKSKTKRDFEFVYYSVVERGRNVSFRTNVCTVNYRDEGNQKLPYEEESCLQDIAIYAGQLN